MTPKELADLPLAQFKRRNWKFPAIWVVPLLAALVAGYLVYEQLREDGPIITIRFEDARGLRVNQTPVKYRGVQVGEVSAIELSKDQQHVIVKSRLRRSAASIAKEGTVFWIVRPEVGIGSITGLGTVITGPEIGLLPGSGRPRKDFVGLESAPLVPEASGLKILLRTYRLGSLKPGSPVYYRGVEVGSVQNCDLSKNATTVDVHVFIRKRYANLVREGSRFWNVSGVDINFGLLSGLEINLESMRSLLAGGIAFATPNEPGGKPVPSGATFFLYETPLQEWLGWRPEIAIGPE